MHYELRTYSLRHEYHEDDLPEHVDNEHGLAEDVLESEPLLRKTSRKRKRFPEAPADTQLPLVALLSQAKDVQSGLGARSKFKGR